MTACPLPRFLGDGDTWFETVNGEEKNILYWTDQNSQGRIKISFTGTTGPTKPTKDGPLSFALHKPPFASVSTVSRGHP
jgi:hypothetical protein